jgi:hypothetical protein
MASLPISANDSLLVSRNAAREKLRDTLRLYVGRGRRYSVKELSNATGVPDRMIESAMCAVDDPDYRPLTLENLLSVTSFLSAPFASAFLELAGLGAYELKDGQPPLPRVLDACASPSDETVSQKRRRLIRELSSLEDDQ